MGYIERFWPDHILTIGGKIPCLHSPDNLSNHVPLCSKLSGSVTHLERSDSSSLKGTPPALLIVLTGGLGLILFLNRKVSGSYSVQSSSSLRRVTNCCIVTVSDLSQDKCTGTMRNKISALTVLALVDDVTLKYRVLSSWALEDITNVIPCRMHLGFIQYPGF